MRHFDFRDPHAVDTGERHHAVLATDVEETTYLFNWDRGNRVPWSELEPFLIAKLPGGFHQGIGDVSIGQSDVAVDGRCGEEAAAWISHQLVRRGTVPASIPVFLVHDDGHEQALGAAAAVLVPGAVPAFA